MVKLMTFPSNEWDVDASDIAWLFGYGEAKNEQDGQAEKLYFVESTVNNKAVGLMGLASGTELTWINMSRCQHTLDDYKNLIEDYDQLAAEQRASLEEKTSSPSTFFSAGEVSALLSYLSINYQLTNNVVRPVCPLPYEEWCAIESYTDVLLVRPATGDYWQPFDATTESLSFRPQATFRKRYRHPTDAMIHNAEGFIEAVFKLLAAQYEQCEIVALNDLDPAELEALAINIYDHFGGLHVLRG